jgi:hypothetical protein
MRSSHRLLLIFFLAAYGSFCLAAGQGSEAMQPAKGELLFSDDFGTSKVGGSWGCVRGENQSNYYQDGMYIIDVVPANSWWRVQSGKSFADSVVEVEATPIEGPDDNVYGLMTGWLNWSNYYLFMISGDGYFTFVKREEGSYTRNDPWTRSEAINLGKATNLVQVKREGETLSFFANGVKLADYEDATFPEGNVGLIAGTTSCGGGNLTVGFDNFSVWAIEET